MPGDWSLMQAHIRDVLANNVTEHERYILKWLAWTVQNPGDRAEVMLVLKSEEEGTGKGALATPMVRIFGTGVHGIRIDKPEHLTGKFNAHLQHTALLYVDEGHWPGNKGDEGAYKGLITEPTFMIEPKGVNAHSVRNCIHIICTSNNDWVTPAGPTARRLAVFKVSPKRVGDRQYFSALFNQMEKSGGTEAMLYDLLNMPLGNWHPREEIPQTDELLEQKLLSMDPDLAWFFDIVSKGILPGSGVGGLGPNEIPSAWLFDDYYRHAGKTGKRHKSIETAIGKKLKQKWLQSTPTALRQRDGTFPGGEDGAKRRGTIYILPPLSECRAALNKHLNATISWPAPGDWTPYYEPEVEEVTGNNHDGLLDDGTPIPF